MSNFSYDGLAPAVHWWGAKSLGVKDLRCAVTLYHTQQAAVPDSLSPPKQTGVPDAQKMVNSAVLPASTGGIVRDIIPRVIPVLHGD